MIGFLRPTTVLFAIFFPAAIAFFTLLYYTITTKCFLRFCNKDVLSTYYIANTIMSIGTYFWSTNNYVHVISQKIKVTNSWLQHFFVSFEYCGAKKGKEGEVKGSYAGSSISDILP